MNLPNAKIELETDHPLQGFSFKILGPEVNGDYLSRDQGENNVFTRDFAGNPFQSGIMYLLTAEHPEHMRNPEVSRVIFDEKGNSLAVTKTEVQPGGLHATCLIGNVTTEQVTTDGYLRPKKSFVLDSVNGIAVWQDAGSNLERVEKLPIEILRELLKETTTFDSYALGVLENTCEVVKLYIINQSKPTAGGKVKVNINDTYVADLFAAGTDAAIAAQFGLPANTPVVASFAVAQSYQNNLVHKISFRHFVSGNEIYSVQTPGNCGIQTQPQPTFKRRKHLEEKAVVIPPDSPEPVNPPPIVKNPVGGNDDIVLTGIGTLYLYFPPDEFYDTDALKYRGFNFNGANELNFPTGVRADAEYAGGQGVIIVDGSVPDGTSFVLRREASDTANQKAAYNKHVTIRRSATPPVDPIPYVVRKEIFGADQLVEGLTQGSWFVREWLSNGIDTIYTGKGKASWDEPYPDGLIVEGYDPPNTYAWYSKIPDNRISEDFDMTLRFTYPDGTQLTKTVRAINVDNQVNQAPVLVTPIGVKNVVMGTAFSFPLPNGNNHFSDPDGDPLIYLLQFSNDGGNTFTSVFPEWLTTNGTTYGGVPPVIAGQSQTVYRLRILASDNKGGTAVDDFNVIAKNNTPVNTCAALEEVAYYINALGNDSYEDSIGFYYKGTATNFKFYMESETQPGVFELYTAETNTPTVTLTGNRSRFNHRIVQAYSNRVWHGHTYKVRLEIYSGSTLLKGVEFPVDMTKPVGTPITGYLCSNAN